MLREELRAVLTPVPCPCPLSLEKHPKHTLISGFYTTPSLAPTTLISLR
jgi:hypothetical protein